MKKQYHITEHGKRELENELDDLLKQRKKVVRKVAEARSFGDLSENAEYSSAKDEQGHVETRISEIEDILKNAEIIKNNKRSKIGLGSTVTLKNGDKVVYEIVGAVEADPLDGKISNESPLGLALCDKTVGDKAIIETPKGKIEYKILSVD